jgi:hypothetical protein
MKSLLFYCLLLSASILGQQVQAQTLSDVHITYQVVAEGGGDMMATALNGSQIELAFKGSKSNVKAALMNNLVNMNMTAIGEQQGLMLLDMMGQKKAVRLKGSELNAAQPANLNKFTGNIQTLKGSKKIAGYQCKKMSMSTPEGQLTMFVCEQIQPKANSSFSAIQKQVKGFPLAAELKRKDGSLIKFIATSVNTSVSDSRFVSDIPSGYQETTLEELQKMGR